MMQLRDVEPGDVGVYERMRCDPVMMAELGGPLPREGIADKVRRDVAAAASGGQWIKMIVLDGEVAGSVALWPDEEDGVPLSEVGWMVLPEFQGRGLAKRAVGELLAAARADGRWGLVHAHPGVTNGPSNGICRALGFELLGEKVVDFAGRMLRANHWVLDTSAQTSTTARL